MFGRELCPPDARQAPLKSSQSDGFVLMCTRSMLSWRFARAGYRDSDMGISTIYDIPMLVDHTHSKTMFKTHGFKHKSGGEAPSHLSTKYVFFKC